MEPSRAWGFVLASALVFVLPGCPGAASTPWDRWPDDRHRAVRRLGCAELGFAVGHDPRIPGTSLLLDLGVRNHCVRPAPFDARALGFFGKDVDGAWARLSLYDPRGEIHAAQIDAEREAVERLRLDVDRHPFPALVTSVCIDTSRVSPEAAQAAPEPLCIEVEP
jgi:hypothetical protein